MALGQQGLWFSCGFITGCLIHTYSQITSNNRDMPVWLEG